MPTTAELAKIHIAKKELGLSDEAYRDMLYVHFRVRSAKDLNKRQVTVLLNRFRAKGWKPKAGERRKAQRTLAASLQDKKIRALWISMSRQGIVKDSSERALAAYVKRMTGIDALQWCNEKQKSRVIESLKQWQEREQEKEIVDWVWRWIVT